MANGAISNFRILETFRGDRGEKSTQVAILSEFKEIECQKFLSDSVCGAVLILFLPEWCVKMTNGAISNFKAIESFGR